MDNGESPLDIPAGIIRWSYQSLHWGWCGV